MKYNKIKSFRRKYLKPSKNRGCGNISPTFKKIKKNKRKRKGKRKEKKSNQESARAKN